MLIMQHCMITSAAAVQQPAGRQSVPVSQCKSQHLHCNIPNHTKQQETALDTYHNSRKHAGMQALKSPPTAVTPIKLALDALHIHSYCR
jgi:hypothetical protein